jgi:hypothetical protein
MINANTPVNESVPDGSVCIANIGPKQQQLRLRFGLVMFAIGIIVAALVILTGVDRAWRISLFLPFYLGAIGYFQARDKT